MDSSDSELESLGDLEEWDDAEDLVPDADEVSDADDDINLLDVDELLNENVEPCGQRKYKATSGLQWQSTPTFELGALHSLPPVTERIAVSLRGGVPISSELSYFAIFFTEQMISK